MNQSECTSIIALFLFGLCVLLLIIGLPVTVLYGGSGLLMAAIVLAAILFGVAGFFTAEPPNVPRASMCCAVAIVALALPSIYSAISDATRKAAEAEAQRVAEAKKAAADAQAAAQAMAAAEAKAAAEARQREEYYAAAQAKARADAIAEARAKEQAEAAARAQAAEAATQKMVADAKIADALRADIRRTRAMIAEQEAQVQEWIRVNIQLTEQANAYTRMRPGAAAATAVAEVSQEARQRRENNIIKAKYNIIELKAHLETAELQLQSLSR